MGEKRDKRAAYNTLDTIKAAGLGPVKRRARTGLYAILGLSLMAAVGAGVYFGLSYWADQEVPQAGPQKASGYKQLEDQHLSADDAARIRGMFEIDKAPAQPGAAPRRKTVFERQLMAFYQDQKGAKHDYVPVEPKYADGLLIQTGTVSEPDAPGKTEAAPTGPKRIGGPQRLSNAQISAVVSKHRKRIKRRLERDLNRYPELAGKLVLIVRVRPDGTVERAQVETPKYHGTGIEEFLLRDVARWKFPRFDGVPYDLTFPLLLSGK